MIAIIAFFSISLLLCSCASSPEKNLSSDPVGVRSIIIDSDVGADDSLAILMAAKDPETMYKVKRIWSMGTAGLGEGNATPVAEFNVYKDPEAYKIMLDSGIPVTVIGLDVCDSQDALISGDELNKMEYGNDLQRYVVLSFSKLLAYREETQGQDNVDICDAIAMSNVIWPDLTGDILLCHATCITDGECAAHGEVIFYRTDITYDSMPDFGDPNVILIVNENYNGLYQRINRLLSSG